MCVFFVDECEGRERRDPNIAPGLLKGVTYKKNSSPIVSGAPHLGVLTEQTVNSIKDVLTEASQIWEKQCGIQFKVAKYQGEGSYKGNDFIFGLDLQGLKDKVSYAVPEPN